MTPSEITRLQSYVRTLFGTETIAVVPPVRKGLSTELVVKGETVGTIHRDVDEGEVSFSIHVTVLEEDLAPPAPLPRARS
jgi:hypothetical protein